MNTSIVLHIKYHDSVNFFKNRELLFNMMSLIIDVLSKNSLSCEIPIEINKNNISIKLTLDCLNTNKTAEDLENEIRAALETKYPNMFIDLSKLVDPYFQISIGVTTNYFIK